MHSELVQGEARRAYAVPSWVTETALPGRINPQRIKSRNDGGATKTDRSGIRLAARGEGSIFCRFSGRSMLKRRSRLGERFPYHWGQPNHAAKQLTAQVLDMPH